MEDRAEPNTDGEAKNLIGDFPLQFKVGRKALKVRVSLGMANEIESVAEKLGMPVNKFIQIAVQRELDINSAHGIEGIFAPQLKPVEEWGASAYAHRQKKLLADALRD